MRINKSSIPSSSTKRFVPSFVRRRAQRQSKQFSTISSSIFDCGSLFVKREMKKRSVSIAREDDEAINDLTT